MPPSAPPPDPIDTPSPAMAQALEAAIAQRRSVRGFRPEPVPEALLRRIFSAAQRAPSNCNVQPWRVYVASGASRDRVRAALLAAFDADRPPAPDFGHIPEFRAEYRDHQVACAVQLYGHMGVARNDRPARRAAMRRNFELFDAPHVAFLGMHRDFGHSVTLDLGAYLQTLLLLLTAHGIASCPMATMREYPDVVRSEFGVPEEIGLQCGLVFGYEDPSVPANRTRTERAPLEHNVVLRGGTRSHGTKNVEQREKRGQARARDQDERAR